MRKRSWLNELIVSIVRSTIDFTPNTTSIKHSVVMTFLSELIKIVSSTKGSCSFNPVCNKHPVGL